MKIDHLFIYYSFIVFDVGYATCSTKKERKLSATIQNIVYEFLTIYTL